MTTQPLPPEGVDTAAFRRVAGRFATGIAVVTTAADGEDHAMTVNSFASVSLDPLLVLFCAEKVSRFHDAVLQAGAWAVSILSADQERASRWFATRGRPFARQFDGFATRRGETVDALLLTDSLAAIECRTVATYDGGDHTVVVGSVTAVELLRDGDPLLYYEGSYRHFDG